MMDPPHLFSGWLAATIALLMLLLLAAAHALYWRLGYDEGRRWIFVLAQTSVIFALAEYFFGLEKDITAFLERPGEVGPWA